MKYYKTLQLMLFRRQFLLGPEKFMPNEFWSSLQLQHGLCLSAHRDLPVVSESLHNLTVTLAGLVYDPFNPDSSQQDIIHSLIYDSSDIESIVELTRTLSGRWIIIFQNIEGTFLFTDPCGFRQIFSYSDGKNTWCASQPELINASHKLSFSKNEMLLELLMDPKYAHSESQWIGNHTIYEDCFHLLPNHYLDIKKYKQVRFYPIKDLPQKETSEIIEIATKILRGSILAITNRHDTFLALTAGLDSRVLLAASKEVSSKIEYYVDRHGVLSNNHPDVWVPKKLAKKLNIRFTVNNSSDSMPGWLVHLLARNVTCARVLSKNQIFYANYSNDEKRISINGNASEICRNYYDKLLEGASADLSLQKLVNIFGYHGQPSFAVKELETWMNDPKLHQINGINLSDILYWEQRLGNWAAQAFSEQDIVIEEISPFNNRLLIETLLSSDRQIRSHPDYLLYRELIKEMWPEALSEPVNPKPFKDKMINILRPFIPSQILEVRRKLLNR